MSTRRSFLGSAALASVVPGILRAERATPDVPMLPELVIDLAGEPDHLTPALSYSTRDWSVIHAIYDSLLDFGPDGAIQPQAAETFETDDAVTFRVKLREGMVFHDGSPVTADAIRRGVEHVQESRSQISELFGRIAELKVIDALHAEIICSEPSAWLPSQLAVWGVLLPEDFSAESLASSPVGSGPYVFEEWVPGSQITLARNPAYPVGTPKGDPIAERVVYRFVPEAATRVADLSSGQAHIIDAVPHDQIAAVEASGHAAISAPILGHAFIRIATDTPPFNDPRVGLALNHGVDVQAIAESLVGADARRLASVFPDPRGLGYDADLEPFAFDPDLARQLLSEAGLENGIEAEIEVVAGSRTDVVEAIVAQLGDIGVRLSIVTSELAQFNQDWPNSAAAPLRFATWRPMYDPFTFLRLVVLQEGFLSRYHNAAADDLIRTSAGESELDEREHLYHDLGRELQSHPCAIYLWNLVSTVGVSSDVQGWQPRGDEYVLPVRRSQ